MQCEGVSEDLEDLDLFLLFLPQPLSMAAEAFCVVAVEPWSSPALRRCCLDFDGYGVLFIIKAFLPRATKLLFFWWSWNDWSHKTCCFRWCRQRTNQHLGGDYLFLFLPQAPQSILQHFHIHQLHFYLYSRNRCHHQCLLTVCGHRYSHQVLHYHHRRNGL